MHVVSVYLHYSKIIWLPWQRPLLKLENEVQIHHQHVKRFHMVKCLRKSVQYIQRYGTTYDEPRREHATQFRLECSPPKLLDQSSPKILHNIVALVVSSSKTKPCYHMANVQRMHVVSVCLHYGNIISLPW